MLRQLMVAQIARDIVVGPRRQGIDLDQPEGRVPTDDRSVGSRRAVAPLERRQPGASAGDGAAQRLLMVAEQYPKDRVVRNDLGRTYFLARKYPEAIEQLKLAIAVDPEDLQANYNLMLCYKGMGDTAKAAEYEKLYLRFKADESAQVITGPYRRLHPEDNNERQLIHEHVSAPIGPAMAPAKTPASVAEKRAVTAGGK